MMKYRVVRLIAAPLLAGLLGCSAPLSTRRKAQVLARWVALLPAESLAALSATAGRELPSAAYSGWAQAR